VRGRRVCALALIGAAVLLAGCGAGSSLSRADSAAIGASITASWDARDQVLPARYAASTKLPQAALDRAQANYLAGLRAVVTGEYLESHAGTLDIRKGFGALTGVGDFTLREDAQVLSVDRRRTLGNGDVVVWAKLWLGQVASHYDSGAIGKGPAIIARVDSTPIYQYQMRKVDGVWKIVGETLVYSSEDTSAAYGPGTPHWVDKQALVSGDEGLVLGVP
jgi:hypothetical protein